MRVKRTRLERGQLEARVLNVLWQADGAMTPGEVHESLPSDHQVAYTTVMTILTRLCTKGELTRAKRGRAFEYTPLFDREDRAAQRMKAVLDATEDQTTALARLVGSLDDDHIEALRSAIDAADTNPQ